MGWSFGDVAFVGEAGLQGGDLFLEFFGTLSDAGFFGVGVDEAFDIDITVAVGDCVNRVGGLREFVLDLGDSAAGEFFDELFVFDGNARGFFAGRGEPDGDDFLIGLVFVFEIADGGDQALELGEDVVGVFAGRTRLRPTRGNKTSTLQPRMYMRGFGI